MPITDHVVPAIIQVFVDKLATKGICYLARGHRLGIGRLRKNYSRWRQIAKTEIRHGEEKQLTSETDKQFLRLLFKRMFTTANELLDEIATDAFTQTSEEVEETRTTENPTTIHANDTQKVKIDRQIHLSRKKRYACKLTLPPLYEIISRTVMEYLNKEKIDEMILDLEGIPDIADMYARRKQGDDIAISDTCRRKSGKRQKKADPKYKDFERASDKSKEANRKSLDKVGLLNPTGDEYLAPHIPHDHYITSSNLPTTHTVTLIPKGNKVYSMKLQCPHLIKPKHSHSCKRIPSCCKGKGEEQTTELPYPGTSIPISSPSLEKSKRIWSNIDRRLTRLEDLLHQVIQRIDMQDNFSDRRQGYLEPEMPEANRQKIQHSSVATSSHSCKRIPSCCKGKGKELTTEPPYPGTSIPASSPSSDKSKRISSDIDRRITRLEEMLRQVIDPIDTLDNFSVRRQGYVAPEFPEAKRQKTQHLSIATSSRDSIAHTPQSTPNTDVTIQSPTLFCLSFLL